LLPRDYELETLIQDSHQLVDDSFMFFRCVHNCVRTYAQHSSELTERMIPFGIYGDDRSLWDRLDNVCVLGYNGSVTKRQLRKMFVFGAEIVNEGGEVWRS